MHICIVVHVSCLPAWCLFAHMEMFEAVGARQFAAACVPTSPAKGAKSRKPVFMTYRLTFLLGIIVLRIAAKRLENIQAL